MYGPNVERRGVLTASIFANLKTSQRFILQELSHVSKRQKDNMALYTSTERNTSVVLLQHYFWGIEFRGDYNIHCDSII